MTEFRILKQARVYEIRRLPNHFETLTYLGGQWQLLSTAPTYILARENLDVHHADYLRAQAQSDS